MKRKDLEIYQFVLCALYLGLEESFQSFLRRLPFLSSDETVDLVDFCAAQEFLDQDFAQEARGSSDKDVLPCIELSHTHRHFRSPFACTTETSTVTQRKGRAPHQHVIT